VQGVTYRCSLDGGFHVLSERGETLDPTSAAVLVALGGDEPAWLATVDALTRVYLAFPGNPDAMQQAAAALDAGEGTDSLAATTTSRAALLALAAVGCAAVGANPNCDRELWDLLLYHRDLRVARRALARNRVLPPQVGPHEDEETRLRVARNPACTATQLDRLARSSSARVRQEVAGNPSTSSATLSWCAAAADWPVRQAVARNRLCPSSCRLRLFRDKIAQVRAAMVLNPTVRRRVLVGRLRDPTPAVHEALATRVELTGKLSRVERAARADDARSYARTRASLKRNPACRARLRRRLEAIERKLQSLTPESREALETAKKAMREDTSIAYLGTRELVTGWLLVVLAVGAGLLIGGLSTSPITGQPQNLAVAVGGGAVLLATLLVTVTLVVVRGPFLGWYPARRPPSLAGRMPLIALAVLFVVAFVASTARVAWQRAIRPPLARLRSPRSS
jgi:hypothetical protein